MQLFILLALCIFFLLGTFFLTALNNSFRKVHKKGSKKQIAAIGKLFFYKYFHKIFFPSQEFESLLFATISALNITRFLYALFAFLFLMVLTGLDHNGISNFFHHEQMGNFILGIVIFILIGFLFGDYLPRILGSKAPALAIKASAAPASIFMLIAFPLTFIFLKLLHAFSKNIYFDHLQGSSDEAKQEIIEIIQESDLSQQLEVHDKKLLASVLRFREHVAREVMVPRVNLFSLEASTSIREAAKMLETEGYSRVPVYKNTIDNITGVLMYKDILHKYMEYEQKNNDPKILDAAIETIQKNVLYTPETKKISHLLQEFRKSQVHLAIIVDEYGGTEGIVTIEDILEQIVGQIADEYDEESELYQPVQDGGWIVDARMSILDAEEQLGIRIPQDGDYDTIGGYIYHCTGTIPPKGSKIERDEFEIEIIRSNDRSVEKVKITPTPLEKEESESVTSTD